MDKINILKSYKTHLQGELSKLSLDLEIYLDNPTSIPEHTNFTEYLDKTISQIAEVNDKIKVVEFLEKQYG